MNKINQLLGFTQESVDPFRAEERNYWFRIEHLARYLFVADYLQQFDIKIMIDLACGAGYGLPIMRQALPTARIVALDNDAQVLQQAQERYAATEAEFMRCDLEQDSLLERLEPASLDAIVSFETLEHLVAPERTIGQFADLLRPEGKLLLSVPNGALEPRNKHGLPKNTYHKQLLSFEQLAEILYRHGFQIDYRLGQTLSNQVFRREVQFLKQRLIEGPLADDAYLTSEAMLHTFARLIGYPSVENVEGSYAIIVVAHKASPKSGHTS